MTTRVVTTQAELDAALADKTLTEDDEILVQSPRGVWITIRGEEVEAEVNVAGESAVGSVCGSARVGSVCGSARVDRVYDSASVGSVCDSARVDRVCGSARVDRVCDSARVDRVYGSARVDRVYDSASVGSVCDSARVDRVCGSARVDRVCGSASVGLATETATVHLHDRSTLTHAGSHVAVFVHSAQATFHGGHLIDLTTLDLAAPATWLDHVGSQPTDGKAVLYKAVDDQWVSPHGACYAPGTSPAAADWRDDTECGGGLHFSPSPAQAQAYFEGASKYVAVEVDVAELRPIPGGTAKAKAPSCRVLYEVDITGRKVEAAAEVTA